MRKIGSHIFYRDVDLNLKFDFDELAEFFKADEDGIGEKLLDEKGHIKMDFLEELIQIYVDSHIKKKFGDNFSLDVMDDGMMIDITWDVDIKQIKQVETEKDWQDKNNSIKLPKLKRVFTTDDLPTILENPSLISEIPEKHPADRK